MTVKPCRPKWKSTMTDRQRFNNQMHYQPVDRCFNMEFGYWNENFKAWPIFVENGITNNDEADAFFSFDHIEKLTGTIWMNPPFPKVVVEERDSTVVMMNSDGLLAEVPKDGHDTIPTSSRHRSSPTGNGGGVSMPARPPRALAKVGSNDHAL